MSSSDLRLLLDTNVWLDNYLPGRSGHDQAARFLRKAIENDATLLFTQGTAKDLFYLIASQLKAEARTRGAAPTPADAAAIREVAWGCLANLSEIATAVGSDASDLWLARKLKSVHADFEDNLILAAAQRAQANFLVTSDRQLLAHAPVAALTPSQACKLLDER